MATYTPCLGEKPDGRCECGASATTEIQVGWHNRQPGEPKHCFGGQYQEVCEECCADLAPPPATLRQGYGQAR